MRNGGCWKHIIPVLALILLALSACTEEADSWDRIRKEGIIRIGLDPTYPPFEATDGRNLYGIDIELAEALASQLGVKPEFVYFGYDGLYDALLTSQVDVLLSALIIVPERTRDFAYTHPYFDAGQVIVFKNSNPAPDLQDLNQQSAAVELGSEGHILARDWQRQMPGLEIQTYGSAQDAITAMMSGDAELAIADSISAWSTIKSESYLAGTESLTSEPFALVVRRKDELLLEKLDTALVELEASGSLDAIIKSWLRP